MRTLKVFEDAKIVLADLEVNLGKEVRSSPVLCVKFNGKIIPLNTPDGRPILMNLDNAIDQ